MNCIKWALLQQILFSVVIGTSLLLGKGGFQIPSDLKVSLGTVFAVQQKNVNKFFLETVIASAECKWSLWLKDCSAKAKVIGKPPQKLKDWQKYDDLLSQRRNTETKVLWRNVCFWEHLVLLWNESSKKTTPRSSVTSAAYCFLSHFVFWVFRRAVVVCTLTSWQSVSGRQSYPMSCVGVHLKDGVN